MERFVPRQSTSGVNHDAQDTRDAIIRAARHLFMAQGLRAISTRQIADACGITQPALYHYFPDKVSLYRAVIEDELEQHRNALGRICQRNEPMAERLRAAARYFLQDTGTDFSMMQHDLRQELGDDERQHISGLFRESMVAPLAAIFAEGATNGILRSPTEGGSDPVTCAYFFMSLVQTTVLRNRAVPLSYAQQQEAADTLVTILLHGLIKTP